MNSGVTHWTEHSVIMLKDGELVVLGVSAECAAAFAEHKDAIESGAVSYHLKKLGGEVHWKMRVPSIPAPVKLHRTDLRKRKRAMIANAAKSAKRIAASGFEQVSKQEHDRRISVCRQCPFWNDTARLGLGHCSICGCTRIKHQFASEQCPRGMW